MQQREDNERRYAAIDRAKAEVADEAYRRKLQQESERAFNQQFKGVERYSSVDSLTKAERRALRWRESNPGLSARQAPSHIREKLLVAVMLMQQRG